MDKNSMNIYWLNPPPRTVVIVADLAWMNFNTYCKDYNWIEPILDWSKYENVSDVVSHILQNDTDVLCVSTYIWNHLLIHKICEEIKRIRPGIIIIQGGPQQGYDDTFFNKHPYIDYLCYSTGHGEEFLKEALSQIKKHKQIIFPNNVPFLITRNYKSSNLKGVFTYPNESSLVHNYNYLTNLVGEAKSVGKIATMPFELSRGCPYSCVYCEWGGGTGTKVSKKPLNIIKQDIEVLSLLQFDDLEIVDANFGIFPQDLEALSYILEQKKLTGYPKTIMTYGLAKVKAEKKEKILDMLFKGGLGNSYSMSLQSTDAGVLAMAKRIDISNDDQFRLAKKYIDLYGATIKTEIIMGLPGSTLELFYEEMDVFQITNTWYNSRSIFSLLPDTEAYTAEYREKYKIKTAIIGSAENEEQIYYKASSGVITKFKSPQEIVVGTFSYTTDEWKEMFFMNKVMRVIGPLLNPNQKASIETRKAFQLIKVKSWYKEIDVWMDRIINGELYNVDVNMINGIFIEQILENHLAEF